MASQPESIPNQSQSSAEREYAWALLDKRPHQSEIISYDPEEIAEIRVLTEKDLKLISRLSGTTSALNKETKAFLDATSIVRALSRIAEDNFERGALDSAAHTVINAIRWQRFAEGLYLSGGVSLTRTNPARLWYLLVEIYMRMDERELALKTMQKAGASITEAADPPFAEMIANANEPELSASGIGGGGSHSGDNSARHGGFRPLFNRNVGLIVGLIVLIVIIFVGIKAQVTAKGMIDHNSLGIDYLNIAYSPGRDEPPDDALILAAQEFAALQARLDSWSWIITVSSVLPPAHDQFVAMERMAELGSGLVAAPSAATGSSRLTDVGSPESICASAIRLSTFDGNLIGQLEKNRTQILAAVPIATKGACNPS